MLKLNHRVQDDNQPAVQDDNQPTDGFIINLYDLAEHYRYENLHDEMMRSHRGGPARCHTL